MSSKLIKEKYLGYILSIFMCCCCFRFFQENYPNAVKVNNFGSYPIFDPLDQANLICVRYISSKLIKETYLGLYLKHSCLFYLFLVFPGKLP